MKVYSKPNSLRYSIALRTHILFIKNFKQFYTDLFDSDYSTSHATRDEPTFNLSETSNLTTANIYALFVQSPNLAT